MPRPKKQRQRRHRGTGSVFPDGKGGFVAKKIVGRLANGRPRYVRRSGDTAAAAWKALEEAHAAPVRIAPGSSPLLRDWLAEWHATDATRAFTRANRKNSIDNHINPVLGHLRIRDITTGDVEAAVRQWAAKPLAPNTVLLILRHLNTAVEAAGRAGHCDTNPVKRAKRPRATKKRVVPFAADELRRIIQAAGTHRPWRIFAALASTGCRIGEALALDVADFDPRAGTLDIHKTLHTSGTCGPTKTEAGARRITVPGMARGVLSASVGGRRSGALFPTRNGGRDCAVNCRANWRRLLAHLGVAFRNVHQMRHSVATRMIGAGEPPPDVARYLGDTVETIVKTYLHATGSDPARRMDAILAEPRGKKRGG